MEGVCMFVGVFVCAVLPQVQEACLLALSCVAMTPSSAFSAQQFTEAILVPTLASPTGQRSTSSDNIV